MKNAEWKEASSILVVEGVFLLSTWGGVTLGEQGNKTEFRLLHFKGIV